MTTRFLTVYCSQCGNAFGPGDDGFSRCEQHYEITKAALLAFTAETNKQYDAEKNGGAHHHLSASLASMSKVVAANMFLSEACQTSVSAQLRDLADAVDQDFVNQKEEV